MWTGSRSDLKRANWCELYQAAIRTNEPHIVGRTLWLWATTTNCQTEHTEQTLKCIKTASGSTQEKRLTVLAAFRLNELVSCLIQHCLISGILASPVSTAYANAQMGRHSQRTRAPKEWAADHYRCQALSWRPNGPSFCHLFCSRMHFCFHTLRTAGEEELKPKMMFNDDLNWKTRLMYQTMPHNSQCLTLNMRTVEEPLQATREKWLSLPERWFRREILSK